MKSVIDFIYGSLNDLEVIKHMILSTEPLIVRFGH